MRSPFLFVNFVRPKISARHEEKNRVRQEQPPLKTQCISALTQK